MSSRRLEWGECGAEHHLIKAGREQTDAEILGKLKELNRHNPNDVVAGLWSVLRTPSRRDCGNAKLAKFWRDVRDSTIWTAAGVWWPVAVRYLATGAVDAVLADLPRLSGVSIWACGMDLSILDMFTLDFPFRTREEREQRLAPDPLHLTFDASYSTSMSMRALAHPTCVASGLRAED